MTDENSNLASGGDASSVDTSSEVKTDSVSAQPAPVVDRGVEGKAEKSKDFGVYDREAVNRIAAKAAREATEKTRAEYEQKFAQQQSAAPAVDLSQQDIDRTRAAVQHLVAQNNVMATTNSLIGKITGAYDRYADYKDVTNNLADIVTSNTAVLFNSYENAADIIYELGKNPEKIPAALYETARDPSNRYAFAKAQQVLNRISSQIKANEAAKTQPTANPPLEHEKPSQQALDNGRSTISALRRLPQYRC
jgi:hypothetical protein